jgi:hypothetical protein
VDYNIIGGEEIHKMSSCEEIEIKTKVIDALRKDDADSLLSLLKNYSFDEKSLKKHLAYTCVNNKLNIMKMLLTNKEIDKRPLLSAQDCAYIFSKEYENIVRWLVFEYKIDKSAPLEEVLIEMSNKDYAKHIENLFNLRELETKLKTKINDFKNTNEKTKKI